MAYSTLLGVLSAFALVAFAVPGARGADTSIIAGRTLKVEPDARFCVVGHDDPADELIHRAFDEAAGDDLATVSIQADCEKLEKFRRNESAMGDVEPSLAVQINLKAGKPMIVGMPRARFLDCMETNLKSRNSSQIYQLGEKSAQAAMTRLKQSMGESVGNVNLEGTQILGVLDRDDSAVYLGLVQRFTQGGKRVQVAAIAASTVVNGLPLTITYSEPFTKPDMFPAMLAETKRFTRDIIQLNEGSG
jgi:hypothetical protein